MSIMTMTSASLAKDLNQEVPEMYVLIAKNSVVGMDAATIADLLGVETLEVQEIQQEQLYRDVRLLLATEYNRSQIDADFNWDTVEQAAVERLAKRVVYENDTETLLKIASIANKAQRRTAPNQNKVLDPAMGGTRVPLTLTSRIVKRLNSKTGQQEIEETRQISVTDGTAENPSFDDIDALLGVSRRPQLASKMTIQTHEADFGLDDLEFPASDAAKAAHQLMKKP